MSETYLVIGMHRSGTSLVSGLLHNSGIDMGNGHLGKVAADNPKGHFEDRRFRKMNDRILLNAQYDVKTWQTEIPTPVANKRLYGQIGRILERATARPRWGFKDPRTCLTWHIWRRHLPQSTRVVYVYRNPVSVASSLMKRGNITYLDKGIELWLIYNQRALPIRRHFQTTFVNYESVLLSGGIPELGIMDDQGLTDTTLFRNKPGAIPEECMHTWKKFLP